MAAIVKEKLNEKNGFLEVNPVSIAVLAFLASMPYQSKRQEFPVTRQERLQIPLLRMQYI